MGSIGFGAGATVGNLLVKGGLKAAYILVVCGALRSGFNELAEANGRPDDGIDFAPGIVVYGWENVKDLTIFTLDTLESIKDGPAR